MNLYILLCAAFVFLYSRSVQAHIPDLDQDLEVASQQVRTCELQVLRDAGDPAARARLIIAYLTRARLVGDWSDVDQAEAVLARAKTLAPGHPELLWAESSLCAYQHHFRAAWLAAKKLIRACPGDPRGHRAAGDALLELGDIGGAAAHYARLAQLNRDFDTLVRQAYLFQAQGHLDEAVSTLQQAIAAADDPGRRNWARVVLASCETARGELTLAETILREVLQERHNDDFALKHLGQVLVAKGKDEEAADLYGRAFSIRPDPVGAGTWAAVERRLGHHPLADTLDQVAEQALRTYVTSGRVAYLRELATFYLRREKNPEEALRLALSRASRCESRICYGSVGRRHRNLDIAGHDLGCLAITLGNQLEHIQRVGGDAGRQRAGKRVGIESGNRRDCGATAGQPVPQRLRSNSEAADRPDPGNYDTAAAGMHRRGDPTGSEWRPDAAGGCPAKWA